MQLVTKKDLQSIASMLVQEGDKVHTKANSASNDITKSNSLLTASTFYRLAIIFSAVASRGEAMSNEQQALRDSEVMEECAKLCENIYSWSGAYSAGALCTHTLDAAAAAIREKAKDQSQPSCTKPPLRDLSNEELFDAAFNFDSGDICENDYWVLHGVDALKELANKILAKAREKV